jgi:hypothetical protein
VERIGRANSIGFEVTTASGTRAASAATASAMPSIGSVSSTQAVA